MIDLHRFYDVRHPLHFVHVPKNGGTSIHSIIRDHPELNIVYVGHGAPLKSLRGKLKLMIWRAESERTASAIRFAIKKYRHEPQIANLIRLGMTSAEQWQAAINDPDHRFHHDVLAEVLNVNHRVDGKKLRLKWTYTPQSAWIDFEDFNNILFIEFNRMKEQLESLFLARSAVPIVLPHQNRTLS